MAPVKINCGNEIMQIVRRAGSGYNEQPRKDVLFQSLMCCPYCLYSKCQNKSDASNGTESTFLSLHAFIAYVVNILIHEYEEFRITDEVCLITSFLPLFLI